MPEIDEWSDLLPATMREVWPVVARVTRRLDGSLVGGTALAIHLRHRFSADLDFLTLKSFSGRHLAARLEAADPTTDVRSGILDEVHAIVRGVRLQVFMAPHRGTRPGYVRDLAPRRYVDGMPVASLADLLATKMDVILYRAKLRDLIDLKAIDESGIYRLEDGLDFHMLRYGTTPADGELEYIVRLLEDPAQLDPDDLFDDRLVETLDYLRRRSVDLRVHLHRLRADIRADPLERDTGRAPLGFTQSYLRDISRPRHSPDLSQ